MLKAVGWLLGTWLAFAATGPALAQETDTNLDGVMAKVVDAKRKDGVLTVRIRLANTSDEDKSFYLVRGLKYDELYLTAGNKKYLVLRDSKNVALAPPANSGGDVYVSIKKGGNWTWWARYPAPPADVKEFSYYWPISAPIDDVPIQD